MSCICFEIITSFFIAVYNFFQRLVPKWRLFRFFWQTRWIFLSKHFLQILSSFGKCLLYLLIAWLSSLTTYLVNPVTACQISQTLSEDHVNADVSVVEMEEKSLKSKAVCFSSIYWLSFPQIFMYTVELWWNILPASSRRNDLSFISRKIICTRVDFIFRFTLKNVPVLSHSHIHDRQDAEWIFLLSFIGICGQHLCLQEY